MHRAALATAAAPLLLDIVKALSKNREPERAVVG